MRNHLIEKYKKDKKFLEENHIYNEQDEHSSCGVGLIASLDGSETREIVELGAVSYTHLTLPTSDLV